MRSRTLREGSVGLLILLGIGLFGGLVLWLRGFNPSNRPYQLIAEFEDTMGVQVGTTVLYRGVSVGRVVSITPRSNAVDLGIEISQSDLRIPKEVLVETVESGLIGEMSIEITPLTALPSSAADIPTVGKGCNGEIVLCDGARLIGETGPSYEALLRSAGELTDLFADPEIVAQLKTVLESVAQTTNDAGVLAQEATALTRAARAELAPLSSSARTATDAAAIAAQQFALTATDINSLIGENRGTLVATLDNVQAASLQLRDTADVLGPRFQNGQLIDDLELLMSNASAASADLQSITSSLNDPTNLLLLQQTLESARDALSSAQKVMSDVDEITGDPAVRQQLRNLINGLGNLVSSTQTLEDQSEVAQVLAPLGEQVRTGRWETAREEGGIANIANTTHRTRQSLPLSASIEELRLEAGDARPILVFDGERYVIRPSAHLAETAAEISNEGAASTKGPTKGTAIEKTPAH